MVMFQITLCDPSPHKPPKFLHFSSAFICLYSVNIEISNLVHRLIVASPNLPRTKCPWKGRGYVAWPILNFGPPSISKERLKLELSNFGTQVGYIKSYQTNKNHSQKFRGYGHVTHLIFYLPLKYLQNG